MTSITDRIVCAKRGGPIFLETIRVNPTTGICPRGLVPCSKVTSMTDTVCIDPNERKEKCPIIDIFAVNETQADFFRANDF